MRVTIGDVGKTGHDVSLHVPPPPEERGAVASKGSGIASMEIADYLRVIRRRIWVVVLIPVLAMASVTAITLSRPTEHSATATVAAPWLISNAPGDAYATANGASQFVADFIAAISVPPVVDAVSEATGAAQNAIQANVTVAPIGESTLIQVRYVSTRAHVTEAVARALAVETLRFLFRPSAVAASQLEETPPRPRRDAGESLRAVQELEVLLAQPQTVSVTPARVEPRAPQVIRGLQVALGGGLLLGLLVVILLELLPFRGQGRSAAPHRARVSPNMRASARGSSETAGLNNDAPSTRVITDPGARTEALRRPVGAADPENERDR
jgi:uncharacterized protein involved in exopolysaccharide biosynthesis